MRLVKALGYKVFGAEHLRLAYRRCIGLPGPMTLRSSIAYPFMQAVSWIVPIDKLKKIVGTPVRGKIGMGKFQLNLETHNIFDMPEVVISSQRPRTINVLVPAFTIETISAGFFGVFAFALLCAECGFHTRLVLFENFNFDVEKFRNSLKKYPIFSNLLDKVEITYIGSRHKPLAISESDLAVATVWYSAYFAEIIRKKCGALHFLYLVQDYEAAFHPVNSSFVLADNSYKLPAVPWFSTTPLQQLFHKKGFYLGNEWQNWCVYNNACSPSTNLEESLNEKRGSVDQNFVFYCRPEVNRNLFHLGALAVITAYQRGLFDDGSNWTFYGIGIGDVEIYLDEAAKLSQLPRMSLEEYQATIGKFDVGLSLMGSPHPSIVPFDLAASGAIVVTNSFETKDANYFSNISSNIICTESTLEDLVAAIEKAIKASKNIDARLAGSRVNYPLDWSETWTEQHKKFLREKINAAFA